MANKNINLHNAKVCKNDEFYTTFETIEKELAYYIQHFRDKTILCNCDDPFQSNFCKYFLINFNKFEIKRLICTSYADSQMYKKNSTKNYGYVLDVNKIELNGEYNFDNIYKYIKKEKMIRKLKSNGDFRSNECVKLLEESDIVVTNPPFSLFKEIVALIIKYNKNFLLISNQNALTYKEVFPLIQNNLVWTGYQFGEMKFRVPNSSPARKTRYWVDENGQKWRSLGNAMWLTNLDIERRHRPIELKKKYSEQDYPKYDNYDAINIRTINDIPYDYFGIMGVPITFINRYNSEQFEIVGEANHGSDNEYDLFKPTIDGKEIFKRILIRRIKNEN